MLSVLILALACSKQEPELPEQPPAYLEAAVRSMNPYRNDVLVGNLSRRLEGTSRENPELRFRLATQLLRAGRTEEAIAGLEALQRAAGGGAKLDAASRAQLQRLLAVAYLRLGEQENCIANHGVDSCLLPIQGDGVHVLPHGSRMALGIYQELLASDPENLSYRWLLNIAHMTLGQYPQGVPDEVRIPPGAFESEFDLGRFRDVAVRAGVAQVAASGGVALEDFNGDGDLDIVTTSWGQGDPMRYFESTGKGTFEERSQLAGLGGQRGGLNLNHADYDGDGRVDLLVLRGAWLGKDGQHPNSLLRNRGEGRFEDRTEAAGVLSFHPTQNAAWGDYDNDGTLDLFIGNESRRGDPHPCELFHNQGDGTFRNAAQGVGLDHVGFVKGSAWGDYDNDGDLDLYLSQFYETNTLYRNDGPVEGFTDVTSAAGVAQPLRSFPTWFFDYDNDGWLDIQVSSFAGFGESALGQVVSDLLGMPTDAERPRLFQNRGDGRFDDVSRAMGFDQVILAMGANFGDLDNDGFLDMYFGTGDPSFETLVPNVMLRNDGGRSFQDVTTAGGFGNVQKGHGIAFGDIDNDGDEDVYAVMGGAYSGDVYQNILFENPGGDHRWLCLRLEGVQSNRFGVGARVKVVVEEGDQAREIHRVVGTGGSFGSSSLQVELGLGRAERIRVLEVAWPTGGTISRFEDVPLDRFLAIREGARTWSELGLAAHSLGEAQGDPHAHHGTDG